jgi:CheY-like chemotaxis protein
MTEPVRRILIVDDNRSVTQLLSRLLADDTPHELSVCHRGGDVLARMEEFGPEIVLLDIGLPDMSGYEVARAIRLEPRFDEVLLVAVTGHVEPEDRARAFEAGFDEHIAKPPDKRAVLAMLKHPKLTAPVGHRTTPPLATVSVTDKTPQLDARPGERLTGHEPVTRLRSIIHELGNANCVVGLAATLLSQSQDAAQVQTVGRMLDQLRPSLDELVAALREVRRKLERGDTSGD